MNEVLQGIRAVKLYAWETFFTSKVLKVRDAELVAVRGYAVQNAINSTFMQTAPVLVAVVTLLVFAGAGGSFTAADLDASVKLENTFTVTSSSNTLTDAVEGVTLNLVAAGTTTV
jgi:ATP-binding cassette subfamily C (CFTR/MRP) protein 10